MKFLNIIRLTILEFLIFDDTKKREDFSVHFKVWSNINKFREKCNSPILGVPS